MRDTASQPGRQRRQLRQLRPLLALAGAAAAIAVLVPPGTTAARHTAFAQAVQFAVLGLVSPALIVLGAPWRLVSARLAGQLATRWSHRHGLTQGLVVLVTFVVAALAWRLPVAVNALVRHPALVAAEAVTLLGAGIALWLELVDSPPFLPGIGKPLRAVFAAVPMWAIWASAYIMGFSRATWFAALAGPSVQAASQAPPGTLGAGLSIVADQEIAVALLWAIPALTFAPVVFWCWLTWLRDSADHADADEDLRAVTGQVAPRPPRGWRSKSA